MISGVPAGTVPRTGAVNPAGPGRPRWPVLGPPARRRRPANPGRPPWPRVGRPGRTQLPISGA